jgi:hypothetical protein
MKSPPVRHGRRAHDGSEPSERQAARAPSAPARRVVQARQGGDCGSSRDLVKGSRTGHRSLEAGPHIREDRLTSHVDDGHVAGGERCSATSKPPSAHHKLPRLAPLLEQHVLHNTQLALRRPHPKPLALREHRAVPAHGIAAGGAGDQRSRQQAAHVRPGLEGEPATGSVGVTLGRAETIRRTARGATPNSVRSATASRCACEGRFIGLCPIVAAREFQNHRGDTPSSLRRPVDRCTDQMGPGPHGHRPRRWRWFGGRSTGRNTRRIRHDGDVSRDTAAYGALPGEVVLRSPLLSAPLWCRRRPPGRRSPQGRPPHGRPTDA